MERMDEWKNLCSILLRANLSNSFHCVERIMLMCVCECVDNTLESDKWKKNVLLSDL